MQVFKYQSNNEIEDQSQCLPSHFFIGCDGNLHDTRMENWHHKPVRKNFRCSHRDIKTVSDFKATLRGGRFTSVGSYPLFFITSDGGCLSFESAIENFREIADSIRSNSNDGWRITHCDVNYESELYCDHSGELIESAYGPKESEQ